MSIYTPDLEPDLYDQTAFLEIVKHFVLARSFSKVRVLLVEPTRVMRDSNRFVPWTATFELHRHPLRRGSVTATRLRLSDR